jgi:hypothetical protein
VLDVLGTEELLGGTDEEEGELDDDEEDEGGSVGFDIVSGRS